MASPDGLRTVGKDARGSVGTDPRTVDTTGDPIKHWRPPAAGADGLRTVGKAARGTVGTDPRTVDTTGSPSTRPEGTEADSP